MNQCIHGIDLLAFQLLCSSEAAQTPTPQRVRAARRDRRIRVVRRAVERLAARAELRHDGLVVRIVAVHRIEGIQRAAAHHVLANQLVRLQLQLHATPSREVRSVSRGTSR